MKEEKDVRCAMGTLVKVDIVEGRNNSEDEDALRLRHPNLLKLIY